MIRRSMIDEIGYFDSVRISADAELYFRVIAFYGRTARTVLFSYDEAYNTSFPMYFAYKRKNSLTQGSEGYSMRSREIGGHRKEYADAFREWHNLQPSRDGNKQSTGSYIGMPRVDPATNRALIYMDFPLRFRPFPVPSSHVVATPFVNQSVVAMMATHRGRFAHFAAPILSLIPYIDRLYLYLNDVSLDEVSAR